MRATMFSCFRLARGRADGCAGKENPAARARIIGMDNLESTLQRSCDENTLPGPFSARRPGFKPGQDRVDCGRHLRNRGHSVDDLELALPAIEVEQRGSILPVHAEAVFQGFRIVVGAGRAWILPYPIF